MKKTLMILFVVLVGFQVSTVKSISIKSNNTSSFSLNQQQPDNFTDQKLSSLKVAMQNSKLLPIPNNIGGKNSQFGQSISVSGNVAAIGAPNVGEVGAVYILTFNGLNWIKTQVLTPSDGVNGDRFGHSISISGGKLLIGSPNNNENGTNSGSAYIFEKTSTEWLQTSKLLADDGFEYDEFAISVSLLGDRALIGAHQTSDNGNKSGSAYVFDLLNGAWLQTSILIADNASGLNQFGYSVSLSEQRLAIGAIGTFNGSGFLYAGSAYIFDLINGDWVQTDNLIADDDAQFDIFGASVSLSGDRLLVGSPHLRGAVDPMNLSAGSAYVFDLTGSSWLQTAKLIPSDTALSDYFGHSVSLIGGRALVGADKYDSVNNANIDIGAAYIFEFSDQTSSWNETAKLSAKDSEVTDAFGIVVALSNNSAFIGSYFDRDNGIKSGSAYVFELSGLNTWQQSEKLTSGDGAAFDQFGVSVSLSGDRALVGAFEDDNDGFNSGSAYIFDLKNNIWVLSAKITANDGGSFDRFGASVSLVGDRAVIGAYGDDDNGVDSGAVYVFDLINETWSQTAKLTTDDQNTGSSFGYSVSLSTDRILIGARFDDGIGIISGSAYIFDFQAGVWSQTVKLLAEDAGPLMFFGSSVSLFGNRALIGAYLDGGLEVSTATGSAYVFDFSGGFWSQTQKLLASDGANKDGFGRSVSLEGDRLLIGANGFNVSTGSENQGSAYIFDLVGFNWLETTKLTANSGELDDWFGGAVSLSGDKALIGASNDNQNGNKSGSAYLYELSDSVWSQTAKFMAGDGVASDLFGTSVVISGSNVLIGALKDDDRGTDSGSVYVINLNVIFSDSFE